jgi:HlyD family secretion protein
MKRWVIIAIVVVVVAVAGFFGYRAYLNSQAKAQSDLQTVIAEKSDLTALVGATGTVRANQTTKLSWQTTGRISQVNVAVGDQVKAGAVLAELAQNSLPQSIILAEADLVSAQRTLDNLLNSKTASAQAELALANAQDALDNAKTERASKNYQRAEDATIDTLRANLILAQNELDKAQEGYSQVQHLGEDSVIRANALSRLGTAQGNYDRAEANLNYALGRPDTVEVSQADGKLALAQAQYDDAVREWERLKDGVDPQDVTAAKARVAAIQATLALNHIDAPFDGTLTEVNIKPGDQVGPNTSSFRLDDLSVLVVDVQITEVDINRVKIGQDVDLTFDAILGNEYTGKVIEVGRVGNSVQGVTNFTISIKLTNPDEQVLPGMTAAVNIVVDQLSDVLTVPNRAVRLLDGQRVVYLLRNGQVEPVQVKIGASSDSISQILSGDIQAGDTIVLNPPVSMTGPGMMFGR